MSKKATLLLLTAVIAFAVNSFHNHTAPAVDLSSMEKVTVISVVDGDTITVSGNRKVRLIGMDTPEKEGPYTKEEPFSEEACQYTRQRLLNATVYLEKDISETDRYHRLLRYVYLEDGTLFNLELVEAGLARAAEYPPDSRHAEQFEAAEAAARKQLLGMWQP